MREKGLRGIESMDRYRGIMMESRFVWNIEPVFEEEKIDDFVNCRYQINTKLNHKRLISIKKHEVK